LSLRVSHISPIATDPVLDSADDIEEESSLEREQLVPHMDRR
jgi:hypothetical protein